MRSRNLGFREGEKSDFDLAFISSGNLGSEKKKIRCLGVKNRHFGSEKKESDFLE